MIARYKDDSDDSDSDSSDDSYSAPNCGKDSSDSSSSDSEGSSVAVRQATTVTGDVSDADGIKKQTSLLMEEMQCQRRLLRGPEVDEFDSQWGVEPTGEFASEVQYRYGCLREEKGALETIEQEMELVEKRAEEKIDKLRIATDAHTGLEIMHQFVLDLLGRETAAAR